MAHEYKSLTESAGLKPGALADATEDELSQIVLYALDSPHGRLTKAVQALGEGWEVVSHDVFQFGNVLVVSYLLRNQIN